MSDAGARFEAEPNVGNHFAWLRTVFGLQRTLMAAVRTSVSLIGFGFTVAQFFERLQDKVPQSLRLAGLDTARDLGLLLIGTGVVSLVVFTWQYKRALDYLRSGAFEAIAAISKKPMHQPTYVVCLVVMVIGTAAFVSVLFRF
jgi:putative membrane protein